MRQPQAMCELRDPEAEAIEEIERQDALAAEKDSAMVCGAVIMFMPMCEVAPNNHQQHTAPTSSSFQCHPTACYNAQQHGPSCMRCSTRWLCQCPPKLPLQDRSDHACPRQTATIANDLNNPTTSTGPNNLNGPQRRQQDPTTCQ